MEVDMSTLLEKSAQFIWNNGRALERAIFSYHLEGGPAGRILAILRTYQNEDGGFGHALEPDLRAPDSQPLFVEFALRTLYECGLHDAEMAYRACDFLAQHADLERGIATIFPSALLYPHAGHWENPASQQPAFDRLVSLVGLASWQGFDHPWLRPAVEACLGHIAAARYEDSHTIQNAFCLLESLPQDSAVEKLYAKLADDLLRANFFVLETPVRTYGLTPLSFALSPGSYCRRIFSDAQIEAHLDELAAHQDADGGWPILWEPPGEMARCEWRAHKTVSALAALRAYGRI
jgi:hypothetical protein